MIPRLVTVFRSPPDGDADGVLARVPAGRRDRVTFAWPGAAASPPLLLIAAGRRAGFSRVRVTGPAADWSAASLGDATAAGMDEAEVLLDGEGPWDALRELRAAGRLAYVVLRSRPGAPGGAARDPANPCGADAFVLEIGPGGPAPDDDRVLGVASSRFRKLGVRGWPLCAFPSLAEDRVISNALVADLHAAPGPFGDAVLRMPFEDPSRVFAEACASCRLSLACDGVPAEGLAAGRGGRLRIRPFGPGLARDLPLDPSGFAARSHPASFLSGRVHILAVEAGVRSCGRIVVDAPDAARQVELLRRQGLRTAEVPVPAALRDRDAGAGVRGAGLHHVFFSRGGEAETAAALQVRYARSQEGDAPLDAAGFGRALGLLLGYPECCIDAFTAAGPDATTTELLAAAWERSTVFHGSLNVLDPVSPFTLVPHLPCRFDCPASLDLAGRVAAHLDAVFPFLGGAVRRHLGRPWIWWDASRGIALDGLPDPDGLGAACRHPDSPLLRTGIRPDPAARAFLDRALLALASGDRVRVEGPVARIRRDGAVVTDLDEGMPPRLFPFVPD